MDLAFNDSTLSSQTHAHTHTGTHIHTLTHTNILKNADTLYISPL